MSSGLSVIVPVLNEEEIIWKNTRILVDYLSGLDLPFEVILISNGSTDRTDELGLELARLNPKIRYFSLDKKGVGQAFCLGVREARHDCVISVDMDLSIDLDLIPRAVELLKVYHIVVGSKKMGFQNRPFWRKAGSGIFILAARLLLGLSFEDYSMAAKAYRRDILLDHLEKIDHGTSYVLEIIYHTTKNGGRTIEVPVFCEDYRESKFNLVHELVYRLRNLIRLWWVYGRKIK